MRISTGVMAWVLLAGIASTGAGLAGAAVNAPQGHPTNRWRYEFYAGRWWYWNADAQWSYFDGGRWVDWRGVPAHSMASDRGVVNPNQRRGTQSTLGYRALGVYPFNYGGPSTPTGGIASPPASSMNPSGSGFGAGTIAGGSVGVGLETGSRSGDAGSGVGGGTVGGADVSGWNQRK